MIVVDASVVADALGAATERGEAAGSRLSRDADLHAPHLIDVEVASAFRRYVAAGLLDEEGAILALQDLAALALTRYEHSALMPRMWELRDNVSPYDAAYVALAEELGCTLVTSDARLSRVRSLRCPVEVIF